jgi:glycosyltransferase involved in cell wall biosynthesis
MSELKPTETGANETGERSSCPLAYVLITPARNEAAFIERTLQSVTSQTVRPLKWVVVSDGSTDGTDELVGWYAARHGWIELLRMPERRERHFAGKVHAFNAGYGRVRHLPYDAVGSLDADISFDPGYFEFLLGKLAANPRLGLVGTPFSEKGMSYDYRYVSIEHVSGACQLFRRRCFEDIGGYVPMKGGGIDHVAVITSRMKGWQTRSFPEKQCEHHRNMGTARYRPAQAKFADGKLDYALGGHPVWELCRSLYQMTQAPLFIGGTLILAGFFWSMLVHRERPVSRELVQFRRREQMFRLKRFVGEKFGWGGAGMRS